MHSLIFCCSSQIWCWSTGSSTFVYKKSPPSLPIHFNSNRSCLAFGFFFLSFCYRRDFSFLFLTYSGDVKITSWKKKPQKENRRFEGKNKKRKRQRGVVINRARACKTTLRCSAIPGVKGKPALLFFRFVSFWGHSTSKRTLFSF